MPDEDINDLPPWRRKLLANRMVIESILFDKELSTPKPVAKRTGLLVLLGIFLFHALLLTQAVVRGGGNLPREDAAAVEMAFGYSEAVDSGNYARLFKPETFEGSGFKAPLYYLSFYPALKLFPSNPAMALASVNSFFLLLIMLSLYFAVRKARNAQSAWFAASLAASFPFVISMGRHASPDIALAAFVAGAYCCYINSDAFENWKWSALFGVCFALGLLSDTGFILYVLPLVVNALNGILNPLTRKNTRVLCVLFLLLAAPWYLRNTLFSFLRELFVRNDLSEAIGIGSISVMNLLRDLALLVDAMHPLLLLVGVVSLVWLFMSVFMAYEEKGLVLAWFLIPYCAYSLFSRADGGNLLPALLPFALAAGIMVPHIARKSLLGLTLLLAVVYQSGFVPGVTISIGGRETGIFGMDLLRGRDFKTSEAITAVHSAAGGREVRVQLVGDDAHFNPESMSVLARKLGYSGMIFVRYPKDYMGLADFVIYKTAGFSAGYASGPYREYSEDISAPGGWFSSVFRETASFEEADTSRLRVYARSARLSAPLAPGTYTLPRFSVGGGTVFENVVVDVGKFNSSTGSYGSFQIFVPQFKYRGADLFSLRFRLKGLSLVPLAEDLSEVRLTGCESVHVLSLKLREEMLNSLLKAGSPYFQNLRVRLDNSFSILGTYRNIGVDMGFSVRPAEAGFNFKLIRLVLGGVGRQFGGVEPMAGAAGEGFQEEGTEAGDAADEEPGHLARLKVPGAKELAQYVDDDTVSKALKVSGYEKVLKRAAEAAQKGRPAQPRHQKAASGSSPAAGAAFPGFLLSLFSMDFNLFDEKSVPFKVKARSITMRNGLLVLR